MYEPSESRTEASEPLVCAACLRELREPGDRRFRYPFVNCGRCGPRSSVSRRLPFQRANTHLAPFEMCDFCEAEYSNSGTRRYQAALTACPECGPKMWIEPAPNFERTGDIVFDVAQLLRGHQIVAIKDWHGIRLAALARYEDAVQRLRQRRADERDPLVVAVLDLVSAAEVAELDERTCQLLASPRAPLIPVKRNESAVLAPSVARKSPTFPMLLADTPFLQLLLEELGKPLVLTAARRRGEPMPRSNEEAREQLATMADYLVLHDLEILDAGEDPIQDMEDFGGRTLISPQD